MCVYLTMLYRAVPRVVPLVVTLRGCGGAASTPCCRTAARGEEGNTTGRESMKKRDALREAAEKTSEAEQESGITMVAKDLSALTIPFSCCDVTVP